jgi:hypothetical protein
LELSKLKDYLHILAGKNILGGFPEFILFIFLKLKKRNAKYIKPNI